MASKTEPKAGTVIVLGIDFGTTNSGIAFAHSDSPDEIKVVMNWSESSADSAKCPTLLRYDHNEQVSHWGFNASEENKTLGWFKLLLLHPEEEAFQYLTTSHELSVARQKMNELQKQPCDLVTDYLTKLLTEAKIRIPSILESQTVRNARLRIVLTVPAMWPQYALETMRIAAGDAIRLAGLDSSAEVDFVSEPEAAALATLKDKFRPERELLEPGDCFVVCDAGGGTVDLITYRVLTLEPFAVEEFVKGEGKLCGAIQLDKEFRELLKKKVSPSVWERISDSKEIFEKQWEMYIKRRFTDKSVKDETVFLDDPEGPQVVTYKRPELLKVFDSVVGQVIELVNDQINLVCGQIKKTTPRTRPKGPPVKYVVLVGGFSKSAYLRQRFNKWRTKVLKHNRPEDILQGDGNDPWSAVSRGAVIFGFNQEKKFRQAVPGATTIDIKARKLPLSIGILCTHDPFLRKEHQIKQRRRCPTLKRYIAVNAVGWSATAGQTITDGQPLFHTFSDTLQTPSDLKARIVVQLAYSKLEKPPMWRDKSVLNLCELSWSPTMAFESLPKSQHSRNANARDLTYHVKVVFDGALAKFSIMYGEEGEEEEVASTDVGVDFSESGKQAQNDTADCPMISA